MTGSAKSFQTAVDFAFKNVVKMSDWINVIVFKVI